MFKQERDLERLMSLRNSRKGLQPGLFDGKEKTRIIRASLTVCSEDVDTSFESKGDSHLTNLQKSGVSPHSQLTEPE
jgi:hypothetical protein